MKRAALSMSESRKSPGRGPVSGPGVALGPGGLSRPHSFPGFACAPEAAPGRSPASRHGAPHPSPHSQAARIHQGRGDEKRGEAARDEASYICAHERSLRELVEEGFGLPEEGALLTYFDRRRERRVVLLFPTRPAAEARAAWALRSGRARREELTILPLRDALVLRNALAPREAPAR